MEKAQIENCLLTSEAVSAMAKAANAKWPVKVFLPTT